MNLFNLPVLGLESGPPVPTTVAWLDGTVLGVLNLPPPDPEIVARVEAEQIRQEQIRQSDNVVVLDDWRK
jgi:hypothetical protein